MMKHLDICDDCYAHLLDNRVYLYVNNQFTELLYIDNIEHIEQPLALIQREIELSSRPSLYSCLRIDY